jgi:8-oxo-dGTP pyrophosphatase MutT (NUDIX family)
MIRGTPRASLVAIADRRLLLVRMHDRDYWLLPGGKLEAGESAEQALRREVVEELGVPVDATSLRKIGRVHGSGRHGDEYDQTLFAGCLAGEPQPQAEIEELAWFAIEEVAALASTPIFRERAWPAIRKHLNLEEP